MSYRWNDVVIANPKRDKREQNRFHGFYPYYAGFSESFASQIISAAGLPDEALIFDPWNGSGTTLRAAVEAGFSAVGLDLNPAMVVVAKARLLPRSESTSLRPLAIEITEQAAQRLESIAENDPLLTWFTRPAAISIRSTERAIRRLLLDTDVSVSTMSCMAATYYVALFLTCRDFTERLRGSNPTWLKAPAPRSKIRVTQRNLHDTFLMKVTSMADALQSGIFGTRHRTDALVQLGDTATYQPPQLADFVLTSPPYCTRLDYVSATQIELAVLDDLSGEREHLSASMMGTTRVPKQPLIPQESWGVTCLTFLNAMKLHPSKASDGYYYKVHLDYFSKLNAALLRVSNSIKPGGGMAVVVQDSYYKDIHNDVATVIVEMAAPSGLHLVRRECFETSTLAQINSKARAYRKSSSACESVLVFDKE